MNSKTLRSVLLMLTVLVIFGSLVVTAQGSARKGSKAPAFKLQSLDGKTLSLDDMTVRNSKTRVVVMDFWATWCPPCREETAFLQRIHEKYGKKGVLVVGVSQDRGSIGGVKAFAREHKLKYTILHDPNGEIGRKYSVRAIPATFILDRRGVIKGSHIGYSQDIGAEMEKQIQSLLK